MGICVRKSWTPRSWGNHAETGIYHWWQLKLWVYWKLFFWPLRLRVFFFLSVLSVFIIIILYNTFGMYLIPLQTSPITFFLPSHPFLPIFEVSSIFLLFHQVQFALLGLPFVWSTYQGKKGSWFSHFQQLSNSISSSLVAVLLSQSSLFYTVEFAIAMSSSVQLSWCIWKIVSLML